MPDWENLDTPERIITLGCSGHVILRFEDNAWVDVERHLIDRQTYKTRRSAALAEWQNLMA